MHTNELTNLLLPYYSDRSVKERIKTRQSLSLCGFDPQFINILSEKLLPATDVQDRSFETSNFHRLYQNLPPKLSEYVVLQAAQNLIRLHASSVGASEEWACMFQRTLNQAVEHKTFGTGAVGTTAEYLWTRYARPPMLVIFIMFSIAAGFVFPFSTSALSHKGTELCSILQAAIRDDDPTKIAFTVVFARAINMNFVKRKGMPTWIPGNRYPATLKKKDYVMADVTCASWRGGGFRDEYKDFFAPGVKVSCARVPGDFAAQIHG